MICVAAVRPATRPYDEATAILVGDALQPLAFQLLARDPAAARRRRRFVCASSTCWREASGTFGMAGGQAIDLAVQGQQLDIAQVEDMHARKTGALIRASVLMAADCAPRSGAGLCMRRSSASPRQSGWRSRFRTICST